MQLSHYAYLALDLARERTLEAEAHNRYADALAGTTGPGRTRRALARTAAIVSRSSASIARRLDSAIDGESLGERSPAA